jgi:hypothetical protein
MLGRKWEGRAGICPANLLSCLQAAVQPPLRIRLLPARQACQGLECSLTLEAAAPQQGVCSRCLGREVTPITVIDSDGGNSFMVAATTLLVRVSAYDCIMILQDPQEAAPPPASCQWLGGLIDFLFKKGELLDAANYCPRLGVRPKKISLDILTYPKIS